MSRKYMVLTPTSLAKRPGWFSWRHKTRDAHDEASAAYLAERGPAARRRRAAERQSNE